LKNNFCDYNRPTPEPSKRRQIETFRDGRITVDAREKDKLKSMMPYLMGLLQTVFVNKFNLPGQRQLNDEFRYCS
jgi:hypothetical protein